MNPGRFYMPSYMGLRNIPISNSMLGMANSTSRGVGLFSRITNGIRSVNWGGILSNANKTLNVVNQAIPLVRQAGPMINNMKSMLRIAKAFGSETTVTKNTQQKKNNHIVSSNSNSNNNLNIANVIDNDGSPNFFV